MNIIDLGLIEYTASYAKQKEILEQRKKGIISDTLISVEHLPVFTIGRTGGLRNLLVDREVLEERNIKLIEVDRGGDITFHGPGQLLLYPVINLRERTMNVHRYIRALEEVMLGFLSEYNIRGCRIKGKSGVWVQDKKIGFVGIGVSRWTSFHGISININNDLGYFSMIRSCGIKGVEITSLAKVLGRTVNISRAKKRLISSFERIFEPLDAAKEISAVA